MRFRPPVRSLVLALLLLVSASASLPVDRATAQDAANPRPCAAPERRQFDFWLGEWTVTNAETGSSSGRNRITAIDGGCALLEQYSNGAYSGTSLNFYDAGDGRWHQSWIDNQGNPLRLHGGLEGGSMVLRSDPAGGGVQRITWTPRDDGSVRQHWQASTDGGASWSTVFDGVYRKTP